MTPEAFPVWTVTTGEAGHISQAVGLAAAIDLPYCEKTGRIRPALAWLPASVAAPLGLDRLLTAESRSSFAPPWPEMVIACGRRAATLSLAIRDAAVQTGGIAPFLVQCLDPRIDARRFDLVICPDHDGARGSNIVTTAGALHRLTEDGLRRAATDLPRRYHLLPRPRAAVLIGGQSGAYRFGIQDARRVAGQLRDLADQGVSLMVTPSRRTGDDNRDLIEKALRGQPNVLFHPGAGADFNPYPGILGLADAVLVTEESVSMISEACFSGRPVFLLGLNGGSVRFNRFHRLLEEKGYIRPYRGSLALWPPPPPLNEAERVGHLVRGAFDRYRDTEGRRGTRR